MGDSGSMSDIPTVGAIPPVSCGLRHSLHTELERIHRLHGLDIFHCSLEINRTRLGLAQWPLFRSVPRPAPIDHGKPAHSYPLRHTPVPDSYSNLQSNCSLYFHGLVAQSQQKETQPPLSLRLRSDPTQYCTAKSKLVGEVTKCPS